MAVSERLYVVRNGLKKITICKHMNTHEIIKYNS